MNSFFAWACLATLAFASASVDYCKLNCEDTGAEHIACGKTEGLSSNCEEGTEAYDFTDLDSFRDQILDIHNRNRSRVAGGAGGKYPKAIHMLTLLWGSELAKMAFHNVKECTGEMDGCRRTNTYHNPGQNIATLPKTAESKIEDLIEEALFGWFGAVKYSTNPPAHIASFPAAGKYEHEHPAAPSARMVVDRNPVVGCAAVEKRQEFTIVCNYGFNVEAGKRLYATGPIAASSCSSRNPEYPNLCSKAETEDYIKTLQV